MPNTVEKRSLECLQKDVYKVMLLKQFRSHNGGHLPGISMLLNCVSAQAKDTEVP